MNTLSKIALALIGFVAVVYTVGANYRQNVHTEIVIEAPRQVVWTHLVDFENYSSWHPSITKLSAELVAGAPLHGTGKMSGQDFVFTLLVVERESELRWEGGLPIPGLFDGEHYFIIEETPEGNVRLIQGEDFTGVIPLFFFNGFKKDFESGYEAVNNGLKHLSEVPRDGT